MIYRSSRIERKTTIRRRDYICIGTRSANSIVRRSAAFSPNRVLMESCGACFTGERCNEHEHECANNQMPAAGAVPWREARARVMRCQRGRRCRGSAAWRGSGAGQGAWQLINAASGRLPPESTGFRASANGGSCRAPAWSIGKGRHEGRAREGANAQELWTPRACRPIAHP